MTDRRNGEVPGPAHRRPGRRPKHPALASRILAAGISLSVTLGLVAAMQNAEAAEVAQPEPVAPDGVPTRVVVIIKRRQVVGAAPVAATPAPRPRADSSTVRTAAPTPTKVVPTKVPISKSNGSR